MNLTYLVIFQLLYLTQELWIRFCALIKTTMQYRYCMNLLISNVNHSYPIKCGDWISLWIAQKSKKLTCLLVHSYIQIEYFKYENKTVLFSRKNFPFFLCYHNIRKWNREKYYELKVKVYFSCLVSFTVESKGWKI